ncbi:TonB-dependent receptor [Fulvivirgaceae bacterium BMA10]|uniref:TonB-dependent receptor n=1 Tax=Splendidivirga corallicola TaxID=3051826 RepID=A0ABT8KN43_9BACT|nr:TonB-dependent receptor [Fulvivirgaceae bacterium BMA10]
MSKYAIFGIFLQCLLYSLLFAGSGKAQRMSLENIQISVELNDASVEEAFEIIEGLTDFRFSYKKRLIHQAKKLNLNKTELSLADLLRSIAKTTHLRFKRIDETIHVTRKEKGGDGFLDKFITEEIVIDRTITGKVTDENGDGLPGVNVLVKATDIGTITDTNGNYTLNIPDDAVTMIFSYVGYLSEEVEIGSQSKIDITLTPDVTTLSEIVVVGYGSEQKANLTGSVGTLKSSELTQVPTASSTGLLAGRIPGVITKQTSGLPGGDDTTIRIRGFQGNPLILVDGVQMTGGFTRIDPNDIESITVLKDASAAVYGSRAGNGVILVTTKRGTAGAPKISYDGSYTIQEATAFHEHVDAGKFIELWRESDLNDIGDIDATYTEEDLNNFRNAAPGFEGGDWVDALIDNLAPMHQHSFKVSGGSDDVRYFTSLGLTDQESYFRSRDFDYDRYNARINLDVDVNENIGFNIDLSYRHDQRVRPQSGLGTIWNELQTAHPIYLTTLPDPTIGVPYTGFSQRNPVARSSQSTQGKYERKDDTFRGKIGLYYNVPFIQGLQARVELNTVLVRRSTKTLFTPFQVFQYDHQNDAYIDHGANAPRSSISDEQFRSNQIYPLLALEYEKNFGNHNIKFLALGEQLTRKFSSFFARREDLLSTSIPELFSGSEDLQTNFGSSGANIGRKSFVGRLNYRFKDRYLFEATFRADGNVLFAPETRWGYFPSISAGWILSEESFMKGIRGIVDNLKIRLSYSQLGDDTADGLSGFDYLTGYTQVREGDPYLLGNNEVQPRIGTLGLVNPALTWEEITLYNFGLEASFLEGKLQLEADLFYRKRDGLLGQNLQAVPSTFGGSLPLVNLNSRTNRGVELRVSYRQDVGKVKLDISPNMTLARAKWGDVLDQEEFDDPDQLRIFGRDGEWVNRNFGYRSNGIFMSQEEIDNHSIIQDGNDNSTLRPGDIKYLDLDGNDTINFRDQEVIAFASGLPELVYGMRIGVQYKNFSLNMLMQGASRFSVNINGSARTMFSNFSTPLTYHYDLRWQPDPDNPDVNINPDAELPAATRSPNSNNALNSDFYRKDVTFIRMKNINLSYSVPEHLISRTGLSNAQIYVAAENLFTLSNLGIYKNSFDPESTQSSAARNYPINRNFTVGLRMSF